VRTSRKKLEPADKIVSLFRWWGGLEPGTKGHWSFVSRVLVFGSGGEFGLRFERVWGVQGREGKTL